LDADGKTPHTARDPVAEAFSEFGFRLLAETVRREPSRNVILSPVSVAFALMMLYNGAGGKTREAIAATLGLQGMSVEDANRSSAALRVDLEAEGSGIELTIASALWANTGLVFAPDFVDRITRLYAATAQSLDFADPATVRVINAWVSQKTHGKIDALLTGADLAPPAECVLTNAVYFKGNWSAPFDPGSTRDRPFTLPDGRRKTVPMMSRTGRYGYLETDGFQAVSLPYGEGRVSMHVYLPAATSSLRAFLDGLGAGPWDDWSSQLQPTRLELALPRASLTCEAEMREPLAALGMGIAFQPEADFAPMGLNGRSIASVKHKTRTEVNEEGTEAAAATAVVMTRSLMEVASMVIDRPFFYAIRDNTSGVLLFMGVVLDPA
jgi:serine protease inhibitor